MRIGKVKGQSQAQVTVNAAISVCGKFRTWEASVSFTSDSFALLASAQRSQA